VLGLLAWFVVRSENWPVVREAFFNWTEFKDTFPEIVRRFGRNVQFFLIAEVFILALALLLAVMRSLPGPVFFPIRVMSIVYTDLFRGVPTVLIVYLLAFGVPSLRLPGVPNDPAFWAVIGWPPYTGTTRTPSSRSPRASVAAASIEMRNGIRVAVIVVIHSTGFLKDSDAEESSRSEVLFLTAISQGAPRCRSDECPPDSSSSPRRRA